MKTNKRQTNNKINSLQQKHATEKSDQAAEIHRLKNVELKKAYGEIEEKNKSILDSIHYAKRIQGALLASDNLLQKNLPEYFIFYKPKDIVSGDFYWAHQRSDLFFLSVCDCTGHGVPGAFMSLLNSTFLNEAVIERKLTKPGEILNEVRKQLIAALNPEGSTEETRDGMDATLIAFDKKTNVLSASARQKVDWINGAFLMVKRSAVEKAGLLDEDFFLYAEEAEWCWRLGKYGELVVYGDSLFRFAGTLQFGRFIE